MLEVIVWTSSVWAVIVPYTNKLEAVTLPFTFTDPDWFKEPDITWSPLNMFEPVVA